MDIKQHMLLRLADLIEQVPERNFFLDTFYLNEEHLPKHEFGRNWEGYPMYVLDTAPDLDTLKERMSQHNVCACALGWAALLDEFRSLGLESMYCDSEAYHPMRLLMPDGSKVYYLVDICRTLFGMNGSQVELLFCPRYGVMHDMTPKQWARLCRLFVQHEGNVEVTLAAFTQEQA